MVAVSQHILCTASLSSYCGSLVFLTNNVQKWVVSEDTDTLRNVMLKLEPWKKIWRGQRRAVDRTDGRGWREPVSAIYTGAIVLQRTQCIDYSYHINSSPVISIVLYEIYRWASLQNVTTSNASSINASCTLQHAFIKWSTISRSRNGLFIERHRKR
jgi:hypothetical protein